MRIRNFLSGFLSVFTFYSFRKPRRYRPQLKPFIPEDFVEDKLNLLIDQNKILEDQIKVVKEKVDE